MVITERQIWVNRHIGWELDIVPCYVVCWREYEKIEITEWCKTESNMELDYLGFHRKAKSGYRQGNPFDKFKLALENPQN